MFRPMRLQKENLNLTSLNPYAIQRGRYVRELASMNVHTHIISTKVNKCIMKTRPTVSLYGMFGRSNERIARSD